MKKVVFGLAFVGISALFATPCEEVISKIDAKIRANGVKEFTLEAVDKGSEIDGKIVGVCGAGTKDIVYKRGSIAPVASDNATSE
ncbi:MAG: DUF1161 domain-containing protein [Campylobacteraceae bacterium]|jgi:hypothetical protein|nr:DUF1161 domain-containing protein [Campylobacteraceae bacterium]